MMAIPKPRRIRCESRLAWCRTQPCVVSFRTPSDPSHIDRPGQKAMGSKTSDFRTVPMAREVHDEYGRIGFVAFELKYSIDLEAEIVRHNALYAEYRKQFRVKREPAKKTSKVVAKCDCGQIHAKVQIIRGIARWWCPKAKDYRRAS